MNIIIANQKGGCTKTTNCILFANFLVLIKKLDTAIIDFDFQRSIKNMWDSDIQLYDNEPLYEVIEADLEEAPGLLKTLENTNGIVIMDMPGKIDDDNIVPVIQKADLVLCPMMFDKITFESTFTFAQIVKHLNPSVPIVFIPTRIKAGVKYEKKDQVINELSSFGDFAPGIPDWIAFQRIDTFTISSEIRNKVESTYDFIFDNYIQKKLVETENL